MDPGLKNNSLLLYRVGPVLCCAPTQSISGIIPPPALHRPPGINRANPGIFRHMGRIISCHDLRYKFGVDESDWQNPGRIVISLEVSEQTGFWVDEIIEVIQTPATGWGPLPAQLPRGIFTHTLLHQDRIHLYAELAALKNIPQHGYLRVYIQHLKQAHSSQQQVVGSDIPGHSASTAATSQLTDKKRQTPKSESNTRADQTVSIKTDDINESRVTQVSVQQHNVTPLARSEKASETPYQDGRTTTTYKTASPTEHQRNTLHKKSLQPEQANAVPGQSSIRNQNRSLVDPLMTKTHREHADPVTTTNTNVIATGNNEFPRTDKNQEKTFKTTDKTFGQTSFHTRPETNTVVASYTEPDTASPGLIIGIFILIVIGLFLITGWLVWTYTPEQKPAQSEITATMSKPVQAQSVQESSGQSTGPIAQPEPNITATDSTLAKKQPPAASHETDNTLPPETGSVDNMVRAEPIPVSTDSHALSMETDATAEHTANEDRAGQVTIEKDAQGLVITIEVDEDEDIFRDSRSLQPVETGDHAMVNDSEETGDLSKPESVQGNEESAVTEQATTIVTNNTEQQPADDRASNPDDDEPRQTAQVARNEIVHIVVRGDTLWHIASRYLNNPYRYPELARLSKIANPDLIYPGDRVRIVKRNRKNPPG